MPLGLVGCSIGLASGSVGVCGDGGWGVVPALAGTLSMAVGCISFAVWMVAAARSKFASVQARLAASKNLSGYDRT